MADNIRYGFKNGQYIQHKTILFNEIERIEFRSKSSASKYLGRNVSYISGCIKENKKAISKYTNQQYDIEIIT